MMWPEGVKSESIPKPFRLPVSCGMSRSWLAVLSLIGAVGVAGSLTITTGPESRIMGVKGLRRGSQGLYKHQNEWLAPLGVGCFEGLCRKRTGACLFALRGGCEVRVRNFTVDGEHDEEHQQDGGKRYGVIGDEDGLAAAVAGLGNQAKEKNVLLDSISGLLAARSRDEHVQSFSNYTLTSGGGDYRAVGEHPRTLSNLVSVQNVSCMPIMRSMCVCVAGFFSSAGVMLCSIVLVTRVIESMPSSKERSASQGSLAPAIALAGIVIGCVSSSCACFFLIIFLFACYCALVHGRDFGVALREPHFCMEVLLTWRWQESSSKALFENDSHGRDALFWSHGNTHACSCPPSSLSESYARATSLFLSAQHADFRICPHCAQALSFTAARLNFPWPLT